MNGLPDTNIAFILAQVAIMNCRVAGMQAENQRRIHQGLCVTFLRDDFLDVEREFEPLIGFNAMMEMGIT